MRAKLFVSLVVVCLSTLLFSCNRAGTPARKLLIYTPHGQDLLRDFVTRYQAIHPEVDVQFLDMGAREILERVRAERNRPQADLWWGAAHTTFQTAAEENLLAPYRPTWADNVPGSSRDSQDRWYGTYQTPEVIVYNSDAVKAEEAPKDWDDALDPKWRDKVLIRNPNPSDSMRAIFGAMIWRFYKDTGSPEKGYDWLRRLDANVHEYTADGTLLMQKLVRREGLDQFMEPAGRLALQGAKRISAWLRVSGERYTGDHGRHRDRAAARPTKQKRSGSMNL